jgi:hypothetical protein
MFNKKLYSVLIVSSHHPNRLDSSKKVFAKWLRGIVDEWYDLGVARKNKKNL